MDSVEKIIEEMGGFIAAIDGDEPIVGLTHAVKRWRSSIEALMREPVATVYRDDYGDVCAQFEPDFYVSDGAPLFAVPPAIPEGFKLVPVELQGDMLYEMWRAVNTKPAHDHESLRKVWKRTLEAAPE